MTGSSLERFQARLPRRSEPGVGSGGSVFHQVIGDTSLKT
jgi:hypothetical protein